MLCGAAGDAGEAGVDPQTGAFQGPRGAADAARAPPGRVLRLTFRGKIVATGVVDSDDAERKPSKRRKSDLDEEVHVLRGRLGRGGR